MGGCQKYKTNVVRGRRRKVRDVSQRLASLDELWSLEEKQWKGDLAIVTVMLTNSCGSGAPMGSEIKEQERGGDGSMEASALIVLSVSGLALESARVAVYFVVAEGGDGSTAVSADPIP